MGEFRGNDIVIRYDEHVCTHSGNCVKTLPSVFDVNRTPWINPNDSTADAIRNAVAKCPSGALSFEEIRKA